jgi:hypothetical protein
MNFKEVNIYEIEECSYEEMDINTFFAYPKGDETSDLCMKIDIDFYYNFSKGELVCFAEDINDTHFFCKKEVLFTTEHIFPLVKFINLPEEIRWKKKTKEKVSKGNIE